MADNTKHSLDSTIATDEIGGIHHQRMKIQIGADGAATDVHSGNPLPVTGPVTDAELRATPVPIATDGLTDAELRATPVPVSGPLTDAQMRASTVNVSLSGNLVDKFSRLRISEPFTVFESKLLYDKAPLFWDESLSGSASSGHSTSNASVTMTVTGAGDAAIRQTRWCHPYQPGKSQLIFLTGTFGTAAAGVVKRIGAHNAVNGMFFEQNGTTDFAVVIRKNSSDTRIVQGNWNVEALDGNGPSGITLDLTKSQIMYVNFEWLGVGTVEFGFVIGADLIPVHRQQHSNVLTNVYTSTPNLPIRYEISSTSGGSTLEQICSTVMSEGSAQPHGVYRYASTSGTVLNANAAGTLYPVIGIRLKSTHLDAVVKEVSSSILIASNDNLEWILMRNPTIAGSAMVWTPLANSAVEVGHNAGGDPAGSTISGTTGTYLRGGYAAQATGGVAPVIENALSLGSTIAGVPDEVILVVRPLSTNLDVYGGMSWREL